MNQQKDIMLASVSKAKYLRALANRDKRFVLVHNLHYQDNATSGEAHSCPQVTDYHPGKAPQNTVYNDFCCMLHLKSKLISSDHMALGL